MYAITATKLDGSVTYIHPRYRDIVRIDAIESLVATFAEYLDAFPADEVPMVRALRSGRPFRFSVPVAAGFSSCEVAVE
jgi:hypothetical protein